MPWLVCDFGHGASSLGGPSMSPQAPHTPLPPSTPLSPCLALEAPHSSPPQSDSVCTWWRLNSVPSPHVTSPNVNLGHPPSVSFLLEIFDLCLTQYKHKLHVTVISMSSVHGSLKRDIDILKDSQRCYTHISWWYISIAVAFLLPL